MGNKKQKLEKETYLNHRHEFIINYYNMLINDMNKFLRMGIETISSLVGFVIVISLGFKEELPLILANCFGIVILFWGWSNLIDSNYLTIKNIALISNIECIYFKKHERNYFNPYIGLFPPYNMLGNLQNQVYLIITFLIISFGITFIPFIEPINNFNVIDVLKKTPNITIVVNCIPIFLITMFLYFVIIRYKTRAANYHYFLIQCTGPGIINDINTFRMVDFSIYGDSSAIINGLEMNEKTINRVKEKIKKIDKCRKIILLLNILLVFAISIVLIIK